MVRNTDTLDTNKKILVADDEENIVQGLMAMLSEDRYTLYSARDGLEALKYLQENTIGLALIDVMMPKCDGLTLFFKVKEQDILTQFIFITGKGTVSTAVDAMRAGAYDYLTKPIEPQRLKSIIPKALEHYQLLLSNRRLEQRIKNLTRFENLTGESNQMKELYNLINTVADSSANIIITGESGTGKELAARAIHKKSSRASNSFIAVNCAALPKDILENELFGHEKGAFTGALKEKPGCFELANRGTLFLDEIGEMPQEIQVKILRAIEEKKFRRLGGRNEINVDVRIIAATNRNPQEMLRNDLYFRLNVFEIEMPPLRDRIGDIQLLLADFLHEFNEKNNKNIKGFSPSCSSVIYQYSWPGNVRELRNVVERAVILCAGEIIETKDLPKRMMPDQEISQEVKVPLDSKLEDVEKIFIKTQLERSGFNKNETAQVLGISLKTLYNKLEKYKLFKN